MAFKRVKFIIIMKKDKYGEIINHKDTYLCIVINLKLFGKVLIGWTDKKGTHFDILFGLHSIIFGTNIQGGIEKTDLFVSIMRVGAFGFEIQKKDINYLYIKEKLNIMSDTTAKKIAELINGVKKEL